MGCPVRVYIPRRFSSSVIMSSISARSSYPMFFSHPDTKTAALEVWELRIQRLGDKKSPSGINRFASASTPDRMSR